MIYVLLYTRVCTIFDPYPSHEITKTLMCHNTFSYDDYLSIYENDFYEHIITVYPLCMLSL